MRWYRQPDVRLRIWLRSIDFGAGFFELFRKLLAIGFKVAMLTALILVAISLVPVNGNPVTGWFATSGLLADPAIRVLVGVLAAMGTKPEALLKLFDVKLGADLGAFRRRRLHRSQTALLDDFTAEFQGVLNVVYRRKPLVVIIDDLDRCLPEQTLQIIETVKLFLDEPGCVFLLAVDREVIEQAIRVKYTDLPAVGELGERFFEKIVQLPYSLPPPAVGKVDSYIRTISSDPDVLTCLPILRGTAPYNPRRIKRGVQAFLLLKDLSADLKPVPSLLAKLVVMQAEFRQVYRAAVNDHSLPARLEQAYRQPELKPDAVVSALMDQYADLYPGLKKLLTLQVGSQDTFRGVAIEAYLSIVDTVAVPEESAQEPRRLPILVSCAIEDQVWGERLADALRSVSERPVIAVPPQPLQVPVGYVVGVWSSNSARSAVVERQWADEVARGIPFLAVRIEDVTSSAFLRDKQVLDAVGKTTDEVKSELLGRLGFVTTEDEEEERTSHSNLPAVPSDFAPREDLLDQVRAPVTVLAGPPGSGKTTFAIRYALDNFHDYDVVWLIRAAYQHDDIAALGDFLGEPADRVLEELPDDHLLIYDGFDDAETALLPSSDAGTVIVTTRNRQWGDVESVVEVEPLPRAESVRFLDVPDADELAEALGDLPLALACARNQMQESGASVRDYLRLLDERGTGFVQHGDLSLRTGLKDVLDRLGPDARRLVQVLSFLGPSPIPDSVVPIVQGEAELIQWSLVRRVHAGRELNPLVGRFVREMLGAEDVVARVLPMVRLLRDRQSLERARPHLDTLIDHTEAIVPAEIARLLVQLGRNGLAAGAWHKAQSHAKRAESLDPHNPDPAELLASIHGYTVVLLGRPDDGRAELAPQLQAAFGKAPFEVVNPEDPIRHLISGVHRTDCVVAVVAADVGVTAELRDQFAVALAVGASIGIALIRIGHAVHQVELDLGPGFPDVPVVRAGSGDEIYELADRLPGWIDRDGTETECTQFRALLMTSEERTSITTIEFDGVQRTASVLAELPGAVEGTVLVLFEMSEAASIMIGSRFSSPFGRGVVTRIVK